MAGLLSYTVSAVLVLTALDAATSSDAAAGRVGGLATGVATVLQHLISPATPLIPDRRTAAAGSSAGGSGGGPIVPDPPTMLPPMPFPFV